MPPSTFCQHDKIMNIKRSEKEKEEVSYETLQTKGEVGVGIRMRNTCKSMAMILGTPSNFAFLG